jgi:hypothetical protein
MFEIKGCSVLGRLKLERRPIANCLAASEIEWIGMGRFAQRTSLEIVSRRAHTLRSTSSTADVEDFRMQKGEMLKMFERVSSTATSLGVLESSFWATPLFWPVRSRSIRRASAIRCSHPHGSSRRKRASARPNACTAAN